MPKRTIYIKDGDLPLWDRAEQVAGDESVSAVIGEALQQYLEGQKTLRGTLRFRDGVDAVSATVQPISGGWLLGVLPDRRGTRWWRRCAPPGCGRIGSRSGPYRPVNSCGCGSRRRPWRPCG